MADSASRESSVPKSRLRPIKVVAALLLPPPRPAPCGIRLVRLMLRCGSNPRTMYKKFRRPDDEIVVIGRQRRVVAGEFPTAALLAMANVQRIENRQRTDEAFDLVKTIVPPAQDTQRQVDLGRG